ncbi:MAG: CDP-alcohol phosphatidyltransferase family protein [Alphaproteobacteria bacterium]|nr:CDP-alcohol phosphatidyltransferase family protein [Alphaproteobacteria bacterium]MBV9371025.1 CDP-alcohol phosphatidyltransferase family protein [Alphaproteobacteria bacterium]MBV9901601.1 CDP-alcohol phosphatidyltransferase family protein [Alphaproteobacteria bacterium]
MPSRITWFWAVQCLTLGRVLLAFLFVVLSPFPELRYFVASIYIAAWSTDFIDGRLARARQVTSRFGGAMDIFGDRYITVLSLLYVGHRGVSLPILAVILLRELYSVAMRMVHVEGRGIMVSHRIIGGFVHLTIGLGTLNLICRPEATVGTLDQAPFVIVSGFYLLYFPWTIIKSFPRIIAAIRNDLR